jgi:hypothetical protein
MIVSKGDHISLHIIQCITGWLNQQTSGACSKHILHKILVKNLEGKNHKEDLKVEGRKC